MMTPIVTTNSSPAGRSRRVAAPSGGGGGAFGAGPNAPAWSGKTTYSNVIFDVDIPVSPSSRTQGVTGFQGFTGYGGITPAQTRISYPTESTPFGTARFLRQHFPGSRASITAVDQATSPWTYFGAEYNNVSTQISGTWSGTLQFETSSNGGSSWTSLSMPGFYGGSYGSSTTVNGTWIDETAGTTPKLFRVRASAWTSGTATVDVGFCGGQAPSRYNVVNFSGTPSRLYIRVVFRTSANWTDKQNAGTKLVFFNQQPENNHLVMATWGSDISAKLVNQFGVNGNNEDLLPTGQVSAHGEWHDMEILINQGTAGVSDGTFQAYVDGVLVNNRTGVRYANTGYSAGSTGLFVDPTYGGGVSPPPGDLYIDTYGFYAETAP